MKRDNKRGPSGKRYKISIRTPQTVQSPAAAHLDQSIKLRTTNENHGSIKKLIGDGHVHHLARCVSGND